jgi:hypothetical protein
MAAPPDDGVWNLGRYDNVMFYNGPPTTSTAPSVGLHGEFYSYYCIQDSALTPAHPSQDLLSHRFV